jgi:hypothetical protein
LIFTMIFPLIFKIFYLPNRLYFLQLSINLVIKLTFMEKEDYFLYLPFFIFITLLYYYCLYFMVNNPEINLNFNQTKSIIDFPNFLFLLPPLAIKKISLNYSNFYHHYLYYYYVNYHLKWIHFLFSFLKSKNNYFLLNLNYLNLSFLFLFQNFMVKKKNKSL